MTGHSDPYLFFSESLPYQILSILTETKNSEREKFNDFPFTSHLPTKIYVNEGAHELQVTYFDANVT